MKLRRTIMSKLLINEHPLQVLPTLAKYAGLNEAIFIQQVHYWTMNPKLGKIVAGKKWIFNSLKHWQEENFPFWTQSVIKRTIKNLENDGLLLSRKDLNKNGYDNTKWYRIDYAAINNLKGPVKRVQDKNSKRKKAFESRSTMEAKVQNVPGGKSTKCTNPKVQNVPAQKYKMYQTIPETTPKTTTDTHAPPQKKSKQPEGVTDTNECVFDLGFYYQLLRYLLNNGWDIPYNCMSSGLITKTFLGYGNTMLILEINYVRLNNSTVYDIITRISKIIKIPPSSIIEECLKMDKSCPHSTLLKTDKDIVEYDRCAICGEPMNNVITTNECVFDESFKYQLLRYLLSNGWDIDYNYKDDSGIHTYLTHSPDELEIEDLKIITLPDNIAENEYEEVKKEILEKPAPVITKSIDTPLRFYTISFLLDWNIPENKEGMLEDLSRVMNTPKTTILEQCCKMYKSCPHSTVLETDEGIIEQDHCVICGEAFTNESILNGAIKLTFYQSLWVLLEMGFEITDVTDTGLITLHKEDYTLRDGPPDFNVLTTCLAPKQHIPGEQTLEVGRDFRVELKKGYDLEKIPLDTCPHVSDNLLIDGACPICQETTSGVPITNGLFGFFQFIRHLLNKGYVFDQVNAKNEVVLTTDYKGPPKFHVFTLTQGVNWDIPGEVRIIRDTSLKIYSSNVRVYYEDTCPHVPDSLLIEGNCPICQEVFSNYTKRAITFNQLLQFVKVKQRYADTSRLEQAYQDEIQHLPLDNLPNYTLQLHVKEYYDELQDNDPTLRKYNITTEEIQFNEDIVKEILRMPDVCPHPSDMLNLHSGNCDKCGEWRVKVVNKEEDDFERLFQREKPNGDKQNYVPPSERSEEEKDELLLSAGRGTGFEEVDGALREIDGSTWRIANERIKRGIAAFMGATGWAVPLTKTMRGQWLSTTKTNLEYGDPIELYKKYKDIVDEAKGNGSTWINGIKSPGSLTGKLEAMRQPEIVNGDKNVMMPEKPNPNIVW
jgi:hypothetical protein